MATREAKPQRKPDPDRVNGMIQSLDEYQVSPDVYEFVDGVQIGLRPSRTGSAIYIMKIKTELGQRNRRAASVAMQVLCAEADAHQVEMFLEAEPFGDVEGPDVGGLTEWYRRFGFVGDAREMLREPRGTE